MDKTLICILSHRGLSEQTRQCLVPLARAGADVVQIDGASDVSFGRSCLISRALEIAPQAGRDTLLLIDDDMVFDRVAAEKLVEYSRSKGVPASAVYATQKGGLAAKRWKDGKRPWLTGLGFFAVPVAQLLALRARVPRVWIEQDQKHVSAWCESYASISLNEWVAEDMDFCMRVGGVDLLPIPVGHLKHVPLYPDAETLRSIAAGERLPSEPPDMGPPKDFTNGHSTAPSA